MSEYTPTETRGGLKANVLGTFDTIVMAIAGSAPAYSLAASSAALIAAAGLFSPAALLWCAIPMLGIAWAFNYLGRLDVNAGASYSWVGRALHPSLGFAAGWSLVVSALIFMVAGSLPAGQYTLSLFSDSLAANTWACVGVGAFVFLVMALLVLLGARITAHAQWIMTGVEIAILAIFGILALFHHRPGASFHLSYLWGFGHFGGMAGFATSALVAGFYFWGWDVTANLSEETTDSKRNSGLGGLLGVAVVFAIFEIFTIALNMNVTDKQISSGTFLSDLGEIIMPGAGGKIMVLAVVLSTVATLETTLIQISRSLFAMGRDNTLPAAFGKTHPKWQTPYVAIGVIVAISLGLFLAASQIGSVNNILQDAVLAIGLQICVYYALAGIAVVVAYRKVVFKSVSNAIFVGIWPGAGALFMAFLFVENCKTLDTEVLLIGLGALAIGIIPLAIYWAKGSEFYTNPPARLDAALAEAVDAEFGGSTLAKASSGNSGGMATDL
ncbi:APC family permease [Streptacidiphilus rugosus]|uniref:APC family permease n=1 Tax=Streptacidiphilus rugosus TaxID=405783 RepID=UPI00056935F1|nr:APC family permease [Streptacidiphilus rugosus]